MTKQDLELKKQALLSELLCEALKKSGAPRLQMEKLEVLHKRINAIVRFQQEATTPAADV